MILGGVSKCLWTWPAKAQHCQVLLYWSVPVSILSLLYGAAGSQCTSLFLRNGRCFPAPWPQLRHQQTRLNAGPGATGYTVTTSVFQKCSWKRRCLLWDFSLGPGTIHLVGCVLDTVLMVGSSPWDNSFGGMFS